MFFIFNLTEVNGVKTNGGIILNANSRKNLNVVVGHEITHILEGTELYTALKDTIISYAKSKGDYDARYKATSKLYEKVKDADIDGEITADLVGEYLFTDEKFIKNLTTNKNLFKKVYDEIKYLVKVATAGSAEKKQLLKVQRAFEKAFETSKTEEKATKNTTKNSGAKYSLEDKADNTDSQGNEPKITADMTEEERYEILKDKKIATPFYEGEVDAFIAEELEGKTNSFAKKAIVTIANKLGIIGSEINFKDVAVKIVLSNSNLRESLSKKATPKQIAKLIPVLSTTAENSIVIERHDNRYYYDTDTVYFDNLLGAYIDGDNLIPVRFGLKHSKTGTTTLYVVVDQNKVALENLDEIKNDRGHQDASPTKEESSSLRRSVTYSISQIIPFVNSKDLLRYLPDGMLTKEQRTAKWEAIAETIKKTNEKNDKKYGEYIENHNLIAAMQMISAAAKKAGYTVKAYHGTGRADRVGTVFRPDRATSGPMAFFTDNKDIADNYARNKADTSLAYDTEYDSYYTQFRVNRNGKNISIPELWKYLSFAERNSIKEKAKHIKFDDDYESIIVDSTAEHGNGAWDAYTLNMHKGNALEALVDTWLETGDLLNREADFIKVLELVGLSDVEYRDPDARHEKVYDTWLKIQKPFDTDNANQSFYDNLSKWIDSKDMTVYERETANADLWDKNSQTPESWLDKLSRDIENDTTHAWTVIPDFVTDYLKEQGFDGIKDKGGKNGGAGHTVWIPFSSEQVKSADPVTYDDNGEVIPLSERFNSSNNDIRYSLSEIVAEDGTSYGIGVKLDSTLLDNLEPKDRISLVKEYVRELQGKVFTAFDEDGEPVDISIAEGNKRFRNSNGNRVATNKDLTTKHISKETKQEAIALIDELISTASYQGSEAARHPHDWLDNDGNNEWDKWTTYIQDKNNTIWEATLHIANTTNGEKILYDISLIKKAEQSGKSDTSLLTLGQSGESDTIPDVNSIAQLTENVKRNAKFSLSDTEDIAPVDNIVDNVDIAPIANKYSDIDGLYTYIRNLKNY